MEVHFEIEALERESVDFINPARNKIHRRAVASTVMNPVVSQKMVKFVND
jgi:hypothetical protein